MTQYHQDTNNPAKRTVPYGSLLLFSAVLLIYAFPDLGYRLRYDRSAILAGEVWRLATFHWTHASFGNFCLDALVFLALGVLTERMDARRFWICLASGMISVSAAIFVLVPSVPFARGLSGLDAALFALAGVGALKAKIEAREWGWVVAIAIVFLGFMRMITIEFLGAPIESTLSGLMNYALIPPPSILVAIVHVAGAGAGILAGLWPLRPRSERKETGTPALI